MARGFAGERSLVHRIQTAARLILELRPHVSGAALETYLEICGNESFATHTADVAANQAQRSLTTAMYQPLVVASAMPEAKRLKRQGHAHAH